MVISRLFLTSLAAVATASVAAVAGPASAYAAPASDGQGYVDSTARCASAAQLVAFGSTEASRVAICDTSDGLQYRGVRVRDGARLIVPASRGSGGSYVADNDGITYSVSSDALAISSGSRTLREEPMLDFHTSATAPEADTAPEPTTSETPVPEGPPLPAEVGGSGS